MYKVSFGFLSDFCDSIFTTLGFRRIKYTVTSVKTVPPLQIDSVSRIFLINARIKFITLMLLSLYEQLMIYAILMVLSVQLSNNP